MELKSGADLHRQYLLHSDVGPSHGFTVMPKQAERTSWNFAPSNLPLLHDETVVFSHDKCGKGSWHLLLYGISTILTGIASFTYENGYSRAYSVVMCVFGAVILLGALFVFLLGRSRELLIVTTHRVYYRYMTHYPGIDVKKHTERMYPLKDITSVGTSESQLYIVLFLVSLFFLGTGALSFTELSSPSTVLALVLGMILFGAYLLLAFRFRTYYLKIYFKQTGNSPLFVAMPLASAACYGDYLWSEAVVKSS
jgi:MFS family permease